MFALVPMYLCKQPVCAHISARFLEDEDTGYIVAAVLSTVVAHGYGSVYRVKLLVITVVAQYDRVYRVNNQVTVCKKS